MAAEERPAPKGTIATVVATAAVTLAIGITAAALGGYLVPGRDLKEAVPAEVTEPVVADARATAAPPRAPDVVLVPVAPDSPGAPAITVPVQPADEVLLAAYEARRDHDGDEDDRDRGREHRGRKHEDDDEGHHEED